MINRVTFKKKKYNKSKQFEKDFIYYIYHIYVNNKLYKSKYIIWERHWEIDNENYGIYYNLRDNENYPIKLYSYVKEPIHGIYWTTDLDAIKKILIEKLNEESPMD